MTQHQTYLRSLELAAAATKSRLDLTKHRGEEGRQVEGILKGIFEQILPRRFAIGSGFVVNFDGAMSTQQDIVLFDNVDNAPLSYVNEAGLFTAESVYATIEVKKTLNNKTLRETAKKVADFRSMTARKLVHLVDTITVTEDGRTFSKPKPGIGAIEVSPRTYLFAMDTDEKSWKDIHSFADAVARACDETGCHLHGVCVLEKEWFALRIANNNPAKIKSFEGNALASLYRKILSDSMTFTIHPAYLDAYFEPGLGSKLWDEVTSRKVG